jgi:hypothetical protein
MNSSLRVVVLLVFIGIGERLMAEDSTSAVIAVLENWVQDNELLNEQNMALYGMDSCLSAAIVILGDSVDGDWSWQLTNMLHRELEMVGLVVLMPKDSARPVNTPVVVLGGALRHAYGQNYMVEASLDVEQRVQLQNGLSPRLCSWSVNKHGVCTGDVANGELEKYMLECVRDFTREYMIVHRPGWWERCTEAYERRQSWLKAIRPPNQ